MTDRPSRFGTFLAELRRRHVGRVAIAYAAVAFVLLQLGEIILPAFAAPESVLRVLVVLALLGFPIAVVLAWVYEITPQGIRRTEDLAPQVPGRRPGGLLPRLAFLGLTIATAAAVGWWLVRWTVPEQVAQSPAPASFETAVTPVSDEAGAPIRSLAVLPLESFSEDRQQDYFSAGMHEALIFQLSQIEALRVVSRTSVMRYAGATKPIPEIAAELGVGGIVEGSVLRADDRVRITVQLIHGPTDSHLWSNSYERELSDILALQGEVARAIAGEIQAELSPEEQMRFASVTPVDPEAHEAYLRGRFEQSKGTPEALQAAIQHYEDAVTKDSTFAPAYASLAGSQLMLEVSDTVEFLEVLLPAALEAAEKAMVLDHSSSEAQAVLAEVQKRVAEAPDSLVEAFKIVQLSLDTLEIPDEEWLAGFTEFGHQMQRVAITREAGAGRPPPVRQVSMARRLAAIGEYDAAVEVLEDVLEREPALPAAWDALEHIYIDQGDYEEAVEVRWERVAGTAARPEEVAAVEALERAVEARGAQGYWEWRRAQLTEREARGEPFSQVEYAEAAVALGYYDEALDRLERAYEARDRNLLSLRSDPSWDPIRGDPRFRALLRKMRRAPRPKAAPRPPKR